MNPSVSFTPNQLSALSTDRHLAVTANAGSGKTTVLVHRFVDILRTTDCSITELVAITFTEKAAGELRTRIARTIERQIAEHAPSTERTRLLRARDRLASAQIHTIHAFCARILREYPVEADIDAGFTVLEEVDASVLLDQSIRETLEAILASAGQKEGADFLAAVRMLGRRKMEEYLSIFVRSKDLLDRLNVHPGILSDATTPADIARYWDNIVRIYLVERIDAPGWRTSLEALLSTARGKSAPGLLNDVREWSASGDDETKIRLYADIREKVLTKAGSVRKNLLGNAEEHEYDQALDQFQKCDAEIGKIAAAYIDPDAREGNLVLAGVLRTLFRTSASILETYERKKLEQGKLDFQDLQIKLRDLLSDVGIREQIARRIKFIMVDEYQDTDVLQYEILKALIPAQGSPLLYVVGDPKQSIYRFRHADVEMFHRTKEDITVLNGGEAGSVILPESFRLLSDIVAFVNTVFSRIMKKGRREAGAGYDELVRGRRNDAPGGVELMIVPGGKNSGSGEEGTGPDESDPNYTECSMIAARLLAMKREGTRVFESGEGGEVPVPFDFRHAAILLRGRTHLRTLEAALEAARIPYAVSGGIGYYQTQEVTDFHNYFKFLLDPADDVSLVGLLRSPFFLLSDAELFLISRVESGETFWDKTRVFATTAGATDGVRQAVGILERNLNSAHRLSVPVLVQEMFRTTGWHATMAGLAFGTQRIANVQKLVRFARDFEGKGLTNLFDVVSRLTVLMREEMKEGQASVDARQNCVNILTVHGAKGLEFPVVFLPFLHRRPVGDSAPFIEPGIGVSFDVARPGRLDESVTPLLQSFLMQRSRAKNEEEEKRILYVACTRARDYLICSGQQRKAVPPASPLAWILTALSFDPSLPVMADIAGPELQLQTLEKDGTIIARKYNWSINVQTRADAPEPVNTPDAGSADIRPDVKFAIDPLRSQAKGEVYSATQIRTFLECPARFYLRYRLGMPERFERPSGFDEFEVADDALKGDVEGTIVHGLLQQYVSGFPPEPELRVAVQNYVHAVTGEQTPAGDTGVEEILLLLKAYESSPARKLIGSASELKTEFTVTTYFGEDFLTGTLDVLCKMPDGSYRIIDYKTDRMTPQTSAEKIARYKSQLCFYALLVRKLLGEVKVRGELVFLRSPDFHASFEFATDEVMEFEKRIRESIEKIQQGHFDMDKSQCDGCGYHLDSKCLLEA